MEETTTPHRGYWQAQGLVELSLSRFAAAMDAEAGHRQRSAFYSLASYHGRTLRVLNSGLHKQDEALVQAALHNFMTLHGGMMHMHRISPREIPLPIALSEHSRGEFVRDLAMRVLAETPPSLGLSAVHKRANRLDLLGKISEDQLQQELHGLIMSGHVTIQDGGYVRTSHPYVELDKDVAGLRALIGRTFYGRFAEAGYDCLGAIDEQLNAFKGAFPDLTGFGEQATSELFINVVRMLMETSIAETNIWRYQDLIHSPYPRPYQRAAFDAFRHGDYQSQIIDAPTGSGKTLIGMMCIQDWLRTLDPGQSILILVPTSNYQQQWIDELCYNPIGLRLPPELIFSGTPADFVRYQQLTGGHPAVLLITYTALSQLASPTGKGGFDAQSVEILLQQANVQHVVLDEVHKVVEDMHSISADVTRLLVSWQNDFSLRSLIGFSGTAKAYGRRFDDLGLSLSYDVPIDDLVAAGFVAPFAELGVPFAYSARERRIRELLEQYKLNLRRYFDLLGPAQLRVWFAAIPEDERRRYGHDILGMYRGRSDWQQALDRRSQEWVDGPADNLKMNEARLVSIVQMANGWSDSDLVAEANADREEFRQIVRELEQVKAELEELVYLPKTIARLRQEGFATTLPTGELRALPDAPLAVSARPEVAKDMLATTITGLYDGLSEWYLRTGEGRVATIKAIIDAEQAARDVSGTIIFDSGRHILWRSGLSTPGYQGLAGLFSEMLGDERFTVMAVLSNEMYLTWDPADPITQRIADFILEEVVEHEVAHSIFNLLVSGLDLPGDTVADLRSEFDQSMSKLKPTLEAMHAARPGYFNRIVLRPMRRRVKRLKLGLSGERLLARMDRRNVHLRRMIQTLFDYGLLAVHFREARTAEVEQVSGAQQKFSVVTMPSGARRKQLMYDLTARIVDAPTLSLNIVIVSNWARTGWNVIQPNLLIDATATRNLTAWQQLRGRAIRAWKTWNNDCYRLLSILVGHHLPFEEQSDVQGDGDLDDDLQELLDGIATHDQRRRLAADGVSALNDEERRQVALKLMTKRNKVTHIYEMVKASGSTSQVTYDRGDKVWKRRESIAAKHAREVSVNPFTGVKSAGDAHAPLIYVADPRNDTPVEFQQHLEIAIKGSDPLIISGWLDDGELP